MILELIVIKFRNILRSFSMSKYIYISAQRQHVEFSLSFFFVFVCCGNGFYGI